MKSGWLQTWQTRVEIGAMILAVPILWYWVGPPDATVAIGTVAIFGSVIWLNWYNNRQFTLTGLTKIIEAKLQMPAGTFTIPDGNYTYNTLAEGQGGWANNQLGLLDCKPCPGASTLLVRWNDCLYVFQFGDGNDIAHQTASNHLPLQGGGHLGPARFDSSLMGGR